MTWPSSYATPFQYFLTHSHLSVPDGSSPCRARPKVNLHGRVLAQQSSPISSGWSYKLWGQRLSERNKRETIVIEGKGRERFVTSTIPFLGLNCGIGICLTLLLWHGFGSDPAKKHVNDSGSQCKLNCGAHLCPLSYKQTTSGEDLYVTHRSNKITTLKIPCLMRRHVQTRMGSSCMGRPLILEGFNPKPLRLR